MHVFNDNIVFFTVLAPSASRLTSVLYDTSMVDEKYYDYPVTK